MARIESSVTSVSWIPREAIEGLTRLPFDMGITHYDMPPPDELNDLEGLLASGAIRFANELRAWIDVQDGRVVSHGYSGTGRIGHTRMRFGPMGVAFPGVQFPDIRHDPDVTNDSVRFVQTAGGRPGMPAPRRVRRKPFVQLSGPTVWSTLALTIHADGTEEHDVVGASSFPRHWIYDHNGRLVKKSGLIDFETWYRESFGEQSPWGKYESPAIVTAVESALERELSLLVIGSNPPFRKLAAGDTLVEQGEPGDELFLLFDGVLAVEIDGQTVTEVGPGAILGEMALFEGGRRTATLRAATPCRVAVVPGDRLDRDALAQVADSRRPSNRSEEG
jgi:Cyclic nucleotide-binding domain